jgi:serine/threonine protein phosphatase PrpC
MEDAHAAVLDLDQQPDDKSNSFFAVYDGHGGMFFCSLFPSPDHRSIS